MYSFVLGLFHADIISPCATPCPGVCEMLGQPRSASSPSPRPVHVYLSPFSALGSTQLLSSSPANCHNSASKSAKGNGVQIEKRVTNNLWCGTFLWAIQVHTCFIMGHSRKNGFSSPSAEKYVEGVFYFYFPLLGGTIFANKFYILIVQSLLIRRGCDNGLLFN